MRSNYLDWRVFVSWKGAYY